MKKQLFISAIAVLNIFNPVIVSASNIFEGEKESIKEEIIIEEDNTFVKPTFKNEESSFNDVTLKYSSQEPTINVDSIEVFPREGRPGDLVTISMEANSETPVNRLTVSFKDLNNFGPTILLTYIPDNNRYEGQLLLEDNLREGPIKISSIEIRNDYGTQRYYDINSNVQYYKNIDFSIFDINLIDSHGPYIDMNSIRIDPIVCGKINLHTIAAQKYITPQAA